MTREIAKTHKYWSRKPAHTINDFVLRYSKKGDVVLDPFCGSGTVGLQSILNNRNFIGYDLNPIAIRISKSSLNLHFDRESFNLELEKLQNFMNDKIMPMYKIRDNEYILYARKHKHYEIETVITCDVEFKKTGEIEQGWMNDYGLQGRKLKGMPDADFPKRFYKDRFSYKGVSKVSDLYTFRNLKALNLIFQHLQAGDYTHFETFILAFSNTLLHVSKLKSEGIRPLGVNNYWIPDDFVDENVCWRYLDRIKDIAQSKIFISELANNMSISSETHFELFNKSCLPMSEIGDNSINYILTDPPYGDVIQYGELSFIWNTWLSAEMPFEQEIVINPKRGQSKHYFLEKLNEFLIESERVLINGAYITISFQNKDLSLWFKLAELAAKLNFNFVDLVAIDFHGSTFNKNWSAKSPKLDLYLTLVKQGGTSRSNFSILNGQNFREYLSKNLPHKFSSLTEATNQVAILGIKAVFEGMSLSEISKSEIEDICLDYKVDSNVENQQQSLF